MNSKTRRILNKLWRGISYKKNKRIVNLKEEQAEKDFKNQIAESDLKDE